MNITLNGESFACSNGSSLLTLAQSLELEGQRYAMELNKEIVPKSEHQSTMLKEGDCVEVVQAIGGG